MFRLLVVLCCVLSLNAQLEEQHPAPEPYSFAFSSPNDDGTSSSREETGDANGRVTGSYTILGADGQQRRVEYVADENGFRANVITNEIGTESQNSADTQYQSSAPTAAELTAQWEASGAGRQARLQAPVGVAQVAPINAVRGAGLISAPVGPIGGGFAGAQGLRFNQGIRVASALPRPVSRIARLPAPVIAAAPLAQPIAIAQPLPAPIAIGGIRTAGFTRTQSVGSLGPIGGGLAGVGVASPFGFRLAPGAVNTLNLGQPGVVLTHLGGNGASFQQLGGNGASFQQLGGNGASFQQLDGLRGLQGLQGFQGQLGQVRGITFGNLPLNGNQAQFGTNFQVLANNGLSAQPVHEVSGSSDSNLIAQRTENKEEDYGRKSK